MGKGGPATQQVPGGAQPSSRQWASACLNEPQCSTRKPARWQRARRPAPPRRTCTKLPDPALILTRQRPCRFSKAACGQLLSLVRSPEALERGGLWRGGASRPRSQDDAAQGAEGAAASGRAAGRRGAAGRGGARAAAAAAAAAAASGRQEAPRGRRRGGGGGGGRSGSGPRRAARGGPAGAQAHAGGGRAAAGGEAGGPQPPSGWAALGGTCFMGCRALPPPPGGATTTPPTRPHQIFDLETNYFQVSSAMGNAIRGYEGFLGGGKTRAPPPVQVRLRVACLPLGAAGPAPGAAGRQRAAVLWSCCAWRLRRRACRRPLQAHMAVGGAAVVVLSPATAQQPTGAPSTPACPAARGAAVQLEQHDGAAGRGRRRRGVGRMTRARAADLRRLQPPPGGVVAARQMNDPVCSRQAGVLYNRGMQAGRVSRIAHPQAAGKGTVFFSHGTPSS